MVDLCSEIEALNRIAHRAPYDLTLCGLRIEHVMCFAASAAEVRAMGREEAQARMDDEMRGLEEHLHYMRTGGE